MELSPPVDLKKVSDWLGVRVRYEPFTGGIDGLYTLLSSGQAVIALNARSHPARRRFTWAHELGHHLLGIKRRGTRRFRMGKKGVSERQCDRFAAHLLMPDDQIRRALGSAKWWRPRTVRLLAARFGVSRQAMRIRLKELSRHERRYLYGPRYPYPPLSWGFAALAIGGILMLLYSLITRRPLPEVR